MKHVLILLPALLFAALAIWARMRRPALYPWLKALPMLWIAGYYSLIIGGRPQPGLLQQIIFAGLMLGCAGDVLLLYPRLFLFGFFAFLAGHVAYLSAFVVSAPAPPGWFWLAALGPGVVYASILSLRTAQKRSLPLIWSYAAMLSSMMAFAWWNDYAAGRFPVLACGALLFAVSDGFWSWNRYVRPVSTAALGILVNYYSGQALIALGALLA